MDASNSIFFEEATDLVEQLEGALLELESNPTEKSTVELVFRHMHTLKGNCSMFGFEKLVELLHELETIYDLVRSNEVALTKEVINSSLSALDHFKRILQDPLIEDPKNQKNQELLIQKFKQYISDAEGNLSGSKDAVALDTGTSNNHALSTYYIQFVPNKEIFDNGTRPLYLLEELMHMGEYRLFPQFQPIEDFNNTDFTKCYSQWELLLETSKTVEEIKDVFVFVEAESEIKIELIGPAGLLDSAELSQLLNDKPIYEASSFNIDELKGKASSITKLPDTPKMSSSEVGNSTTSTDTGSKNITSIRVPSSKLDELLNVVSELVTTQAGLSLYAEKYHHPDLEAISENVQKLSRQLRDVAFGMTLIPIKNVIGRFQRMIRDVSESLGKHVSFEIHGGDTELDKGIIERLTDPIMHILRNSLDHGIESVKERIEKGKPEVGTIKFSAFYSGTYVMIEIMDDGKGMDPNKIREKAISKKLISAEASLTDKEIFELIFEPGFSTAAAVTELSGRGVGMDVVKRNITALRGEIIVDSELEKWSKVTIKLPLTLSIIDGLLVDIGGDKFVIPLAVVDKCYEIDYAQMLDNFNDLIVLDEKQIPYLNLREKFLVESAPPPTSQLIVVETDGIKVGISVDAIDGEYQAVLKPLGKHYGEQDFISGATILGDGSIALVLDTNKIVSSFSKVYSTEK